MRARAIRRSGALPRAAPSDKAAPARDRHCGRQLQLPSTGEHVQPASGHVPPQVGYAPPPVHGVRQKQSPPTVVHSVPGWLQVPSHAGALPPAQNGGRQNGGSPGTAIVHVQPGGQPAGQSGGGGSARHAQYGTATSPQQ